MKANCSFIIIIILIDLEIKQINRFIFLLFTPDNNLE